MKILIINGPNLNLLGRREPSVYGSECFEDYFGQLQRAFPEAVLEYFQTNIEGEIVDRIQQAEHSFDGVVLNAGGYTHTSVAIRDAISAVVIPVVEVHVSNILAREDFRHSSLLAPVCRGSIMGFGMESYRLGVQWFTGGRV